MTADPSGRSPAASSTGGRVSLSDRAFAWTLTVFFLVFAGIGWLVFDRVLTWAWIAAAVMATVALAYPALLWPFNLFWCRSVAPRVSTFNNHLALGICYFVFITPAALLMRIVGRDRMTRSFETSRQSYFEPVERQANRENFREVF